MMASASSVPFPAKGESSCLSKNQRSRWQGGCSDNHLVPFDQTRARIEKLKWPVQSSCNASATQDMFWRERTAGWSCFSVSNPKDASAGIALLSDSCVDAGIGSLESEFRPGALEGLEWSGGDKFDDEFAMSEEICGLSVQASGTSSVKKEVPRAGEQGVWSVVIPTYNRLHILSKCLQALEQQRDYFSSGIVSYEVIVVDDGSTDGTVDFLKSKEKISSKREGVTEKVRSQERQWDELSSKAESFASASCTGVEGFNLGSFVQSNGADLGNGLLVQSERFPHVKLIKQKHEGAAKARNLGLKYARGAIIVFVDSDLIVTSNFLKAHGEALRNAFLEDGDDRAFTYGRVVNTSNLQSSPSGKVKITDSSPALFATRNVAISLHRLLEAGKLLGHDADGPFDDTFSEYGWEDLELGVRLRQCGARIEQAPAAFGYRSYPAL